MTFTRHIADGIHRVADGPVNWYLVEDDDGVTIVDAGLPASGTRSAGRWPRSGGSRPTCGRSC
jgi:hypothetical protein